MKQFWGVSIVGLMRLPVTQETTDSNSVHPATFGSYCQPGRRLPSEGRGRGFESLRTDHYKYSVSQHQPRVHMLIAVLVVLALLGVAGFLAYRKNKAKVDGVVGAVGAGARSTRDAVKTQLQ
jgi:hypothetical protein